MRWSNVFLGEGRLRSCLTAQISFHLHNSVISKIMSESYVGLQPWPESFRDTNGMYINLSKHDRTTEDSGVAINWISPLVLPADYGSLQGELHVRVNPSKDQLALLCPTGIVCLWNPSRPPAHTHKLIISLLGGQVKNLGLFKTIWRKNTKYVGKYWWDSFLFMHEG